MNLQTLILQMNSSFHSTNKLRRSKSVGAASTASAWCIRKRDLLRKNSM